MSNSESETRRNAEASPETPAGGHPDYPSVSIVVGGRFVAFDIAKILERRGALAGIVSAFPRALREGIPRRHLTWNPLLGIRSTLANRFRVDPTGEVGYRHAVAFGRWAARHLPRADVVQAWTGYALETLHAAKQAGTVSIAFRASAHIEVQAELLATEYSQFGFTAPAVHAAMIERELEEYETADAVNVISTFAYRTFVERGFPASKLILTPLGVDLGESKQLERSVRKRDGPLKILFLGQVSLRKGVHYLLQAVRDLGASAVTLSLVGGATADGRSLLDRFARSGEWKGKASRQELGAIFANHDVLVLPSVEDGFGAVICEAMASGLPVIATTNTGGPDVIRNGIDGFVVPARSADALRDALIILASDRARCAEMGRAAAAAMRELRSWDRFVDEMLAEYGARTHGGRVVR